MPPPPASGITSPPSVADWETHPRWGEDPSVAACKLRATWDQLVARKKAGSGVAFKLGGLGRLEDRPRFKVSLALGSEAFC
jgi:hypothetical protein